MGERAAADPGRHGGPAGDVPTTALLLEHVPAEQTGTASGVFNPSRQIGGSLAVAVFGALISAPAGFQHGLRVSLTMAAVIALLAALTTPRMGAARRRDA
jgi:sugar phosphate permease